VPVGTGRGLERSPEQQDWTELEEGDYLLPWLLHITMYEICERPCCAA
jgi:hypothetical protein